MKALVLMLTMVAFTPIANAEGDAADRALTEQMMTHKTPPIGADYGDSGKTTIQAGHADTVLKEETDKTERP
jgi:hypothetical protein